MFPILLSASSFAAGFSFADHTDAASLESELMESSSLVQAVELQNYESADGKTNTMAVVVVGHNNRTSALALEGASCKGGISTGCFAGYSILSAAVNIDPDDLSATLFAWDEDGEFGKVGTVESELKAGELLVSAHWSDLGVSALGGLNDGGDEPEAMTGGEIAAALVISFVAGLASAAVYDWWTSDGTAADEDYDGDGTTNENDADDDGDGSNDDDDDFPFDPGAHIRTPIDVSLLFDASELLERDQVQVLTH